MTNAHIKQEEILEIIKLYLQNSPNLQETRNSLQHGHFTSSLGN